MGWRVLARQDSEGIRGQVVVLDSSPVKTLQGLANKTVAFANPYGFTGYYVPMDALLRAGVEVTPLFSGNQEAAMGQLLSGEVAAAGVKHQVMASFAQRRQVKYRVLAESEPYFDLAVMPSPRAMHTLGHELGKLTIAEQAETEAEAEAELTCLKSMGVDFVQGYLLHQPAPLPMA